LTDADGIAFLTWALPQLHLRWAGFRRNRRQVLRRIDRRRAELGLPDVAAYRRRLEDDAGEWRVLDGLCRATISRFARDRSVWDELVENWLPHLASTARGPVRIWSAGCGAGEEPYTLAIAWQLAIAGSHPSTLEVLATDVDDVQLARAQAASYPPGTLRELPSAWRAAAFERIAGEDRLRPEYRACVRFVHHDVRTPLRDGPFDLILCRNLAFTYFDEEVQRAVAASFAEKLRPGGALVIGTGEHLPEAREGRRCHELAPCIYRLTS
jgi:chemotaxis protein methyltransferase CheR